MPTPLRPELYYRLLHRFHNVIIADEGEELRGEVVTDPSTGQLQLQVDWPGEYYRISCPYCPDTRCRLWINHRWGLYVPELKTDNLWLACCFNEDCLRVSGRAWDLKNAVFWDFVRGRHADPVLRGLPASPRMCQPKPIAEVVYRLRDFPDDHPANVYLRSRGYDTNWLSRAFRVGYCETPSYEFRMAADRIVIPVFFRGALAGWQARFIGEPPDKSVPKYWTMPGMQKSQLLYNADVASRYPFVVVCEGVTDVWSFGQEAVALFGKKISGAQTRLLASTWGQGAVIILLDGDATDEALEIYDALGKQVRRKVIVPLPEDKDPGDFSRESLRELVFATALRQGVDLSGLTGSKGPPQLHA